MSRRKHAALVLSGGGARGAYAVGVLEGMLEVLGLSAADKSPFNIFSGTSVGSINSTFCAANAHRGDLNIRRLRKIWQSLGVQTHLRVRMKGRLGMRAFSLSGSALDAGPLELLVRRNLSFNSLHRNVEDGTVRAAMVAAFALGTARTTIFSELHRGVEPREPRDPTRAEWRGRLGADQVLASSAMPFVFPARKVNMGGQTDHFCDGGLRFNTPISPAIRAGASKLVVISLRNEQSENEGLAPISSYPKSTFMIGRLLNAMLVDPFNYDLEVLEGFNRLTRALKEGLSSEQLANVEKVLIETRGAPYREVEKLVFSPSQDLGRLAHEHLKKNLAGYKVGTLARYLLKKAAHEEATWEAEWAAFVLFDGRYAEQLIELGRKDALARGDEIRSFFSQETPGAL